MFKKKSSSSEDPIIDGLASNHTLIDMIKNCNSMSDKIHNSNDPSALIQKVLIATNLLNKYFNTVGVIKKQSDSNSPTVQLLTNFLNPLFESFSFLNNKDVKLEEIFLCVSSIYEISHSIVPFPSIRQFFSNLFFFYQVKHPFREIVTNIVTEIMKAKQISINLVTIDFFQLLFTELFPSQFLSDTANWYVELFIKTFDRSKAFNLDSEEISNIYFSSFKSQPKIPESNVGPASLLFSFMISLNKDDTGNVFSFQSLSNFCDIQKTNNYLVLVRSLFYMSQGLNKTLNLQVISFMISSIQTNSEISSLCFLVFIKLFQNTSIPLSEYDNIIKLQAFFKFDCEKNDEMHILRLMKMFKALYDREYFDIKNCLSYLIDKVALDISNPKYNPFYKFLSLCAKPNSISSKTILKASDIGTPHFFSVFALSLPNDTFYSMLVNNSHYRTLLFFCFSELKDKKVQWEFFNKILLLQTNFEDSKHFTKISSTFLNESKSSFVLLKTLHFISFNISNVMLEMLISCFYESENTINLFLNNNGLTWFNKFIIPIDNAIISDDFIALFLNSLVSHKTHDIVSNWISSLQPTHRIFHMSSDILWFLVFGSKKSIVPTTIRIPALLYLLKNDEDLLKFEPSPWNSAYASKLGINEFIKHEINIDGNPLTDRMINFHITSTQFRYLIEHSKKRANFINPNFDHFSLFEFAPNTNNSIINIKANLKSISFWFKADPSYVKEKTINLMTSNVISLSFNSTTLFVTIGKVTLENSINPTQQWVFITLSLHDSEHNEEKNTHEIKSSAENISNNNSLDTNDGCFLFVHINRTIAKGYLAKRQKFTFISFGSSTSYDCRWYLGGCIRCMNRSITENEINNLINEGPSLLTGNDSVLSTCNVKINNNMETSNSDRVCAFCCDNSNFVITPFSIRQANISTNVFPVPYSGFSLFAKRRRYFHLIVIKLIKTNDIDDANDLVQLLLNLYSVNNCQIKNFWLYISVILKENKDLFIKAPIIIKKILSYFHRNSFKKWFSVIYNDLNLWSIYPDIFEKSITNNCLSQPNFLLFLFSMLNFIDNPKFFELISSIILRIENQPHVNSLLIFYLIANNNYPSLQSKFLSMMSDDFFKNIPFESIKNMIIAIPPSVSSQIIDRVCKISYNDPSYLQPDIFLGYPFAKHSVFGNYRMWFQAFSLLCAVDPNTFSQNENSSLIESFKLLKIERPSALPIVISLIFYNLFLLFRTNQIDSNNNDQNVEKDDLQQISSQNTRFIFEAIELILVFFEIEPKLFLQQKLLKVINFYTPILFGSKVLKETYNLTDFSHAHDHPLFSIWNVSPSIIDFQYPSNIIAFQSLFACIQNKSNSSKLINGNDNCDSNESNNSAINTKIESNSMDNLSNSEYFKNLNANYLETLKKFYIKLIMISSTNITSLRCILLFNSPQQNFNINIITNILSVETMSRISNVKSRKNIFTVISEGIHQGIFGKNPNIFKNKDDASNYMMIYQSFFDILEMFLTKKSNMNNFVSSIKIILLDMFGVLTAADTDTLLNRFNEFLTREDSNSNIYENIVSVGLFDEEKFLDLFLSLSKKPSHILLNLKNRFLSEHPNSPSNSTQLNHYSIFDHIKTISQNNSKLLNQFNTVFVDFDPCVVKKIFHPITAFYINLILRKEERDFFRIWQLLLLSEMQNPIMFIPPNSFASQSQSNLTEPSKEKSANQDDDNESVISDDIKQENLKLVEDKTADFFLDLNISESKWNAFSYIVTGHSWPLQVPKFLVPSLEKRTQIFLGETLDETKLQLSPPQLSPFLSQVRSKNKIICFYAWKHTKFTSFVNFQIQQYSQAYFCSNEFLYELFTNTYASFGEIKNSFTIYFLKRIDAFLCTLFETESHILILLNSCVDNSSNSQLNSEVQKRLHLDSSIKSPLIYKTFLELFELGFYSENSSLFCGHPVIIVPLSGIFCVVPHFYFHQPISLLIYSHKCTDFIITPGPSKKIIPFEFVSRLFAISSTNIEDLQSNSSNFKVLKQCQKILQEIYQNSQQLNYKKIKSIYKIWENQKISTYEFLIYSNFLSGRSFSDLSQYPVFPWIIGDVFINNKKNANTLLQSNSTPEVDEYKSYDNLNIVESNNQILMLKLRDLKKPMGQQTLERAQFYDETYKNNGYFYVSHYSLMATIFNQFIRVSPFTEMHLDLNKGFDVKERLFLNISSAFKSATEINQNDVSELTPEWFSFPEIFNNINEIGLDDVELPSPIKNSCQFVLLNRKQLESSKEIGEWIDLIFGASQQGNAAFLTKNLFNPIAYHIVAGEIERNEVIKLQLENWGQCPSLIFKKPLGIRKGPSRQLINALCVKKANDEFCSFSEIMKVLTVSKHSSTVVSVSKPNLSLFFEDNQKIYFNIFNPFFSYSRNVSTSNNGLFLVVDTAYAFSLVFRLIYGKDNHVSNAKGYSLMVHNQPVISAINGIDMICASYYGTNVIIWDFVRSTICRVIVNPYKVISISFDEDFGLLYILGNERIDMYTINGTFVTSKDLSKATSLFVFSLDSKSTFLKPIFIGFENGKVEILIYNEESNQIQVIKIINTNLGPISLIGASMRKGEVIIKSRDNNKCIISTGS